MGLVGNLSVGRSTGRRLPVSTGSLLGRTYAEWVTQAAVLAPTTQLWGSGGLDAGTYRTTAAALTGSMTGTTWNTTAGVDRNNRSIQRGLQHGFATQEPFDENVSSGRVIVYTGTQMAFSSNAIATARNGYTSLGSVGDQGADYYFMTNLKYWDNALGYVVQGNPSVGGPFTQYVW